MILYPEERMIYNKTVGFIRVLNIVDVIEQVGLYTIYGEVEKHDVDIEVHNETELKLVIEVTNWRSYPYMHEKKAVSIRDNFRRYSCSKLLIVSFHHNYRMWTNYFDSDMDIVEIGFQTQPLDYYLFFSERGRAQGMRPDGPSSKGEVRRKIEEYLRQKGLI